MPKYKKYILFQCDAYYPMGGLGDITGSFDSIEEARDYMNENPSFSNDIVDRDTWEIVEENYKNPYK